MASGLPGGLGVKTIWKLPALSQATGSVSVSESDYIFVSIWGEKKQLWGPDLFWPWGLTSGSVW